MSDQPAAKPPIRSNGYWHPDAIVFAITLVVAFTLLVTLILVRRRDEANTYAEILLVFSALYSGAVGIRGGTYESSAPGLNKITGAGWLVILGVLFGFSVGLVQKTVIADIIKAKADDEKRKEIAVSEGRAREERERAERLSHEVSALEEEQHKAVEAAKKSNEATKTALASVAEKAEGCPPATRKAILETTHDMESQLFYTGLLLHSDFYTSIDKVQQQVKKVGETVEGLPRTCLDLSTLKTGLEQSGLLGQIVDAACAKRQSAIAAGVAGAPTVPPNPAPSANVTQDAGSISAPDAGKP